MLKVSAARIGVQVRVDEAGDDRAPAEIDDARRRAGERANLARGADAEILPSRIASASRADDLRVDGHDLAVEEHDVRRLRIGCDADERTADRRDNRSPAR